MSKDICWKVHKYYISGGGLPINIIEFFYKDTSKVLRVDTKIWENEAESIVNWVKNNWNGIKTSIDNINVIIKVKE